MDWADELAAEISTRFGCIHSTADLPAILRKCKADGMRQAADLVTPHPEELLTEHAVLLAAKSMFLAATADRIENGEA